MYTASVPVSYAKTQTITIGSVDFSINPVKSNDPIVAREDDIKLRYIDAFQDTDVVQTRYSGKLKEDIILKKPGHPKEFVYEMDLSKMTYQIDGSGDISFYPKEPVFKDLALLSASDDPVPLDILKKVTNNGKPKLFTIKAPTMTDRNGKESKASDVKVTVEGNLLKLTPNGQWLASHEYPVILDPIVEFQAIPTKEEYAKRSLNSYVFENNDGSRTLIAFSGDVSYIDPATGKALPIDTTLREMPGGGWFEDKANYYLFVPGFADEEIIFIARVRDRSDKISYRASALHIPGRLIRDGDFANRQVIYDNAFGEGRDYILTADSTSFKKEIRINEKEKQPRDLVFDFEITVPDNKVKIMDMKTGEIEERDIERLIIQGDEQISFDIVGGAPYFRVFRAWDSAGKVINIKASFYSKDGKLLLQKIVPREFLATALYPVFTDTTTAYYSNSCDGELSKNWTTDWATTRAATTADNNRSADAVNWFGARTAGDAVERLFFVFDTSSIGTGNNVTAATLYIYHRGSDFSDPDNIRGFVVSNTQVSNTSLVNTDFDNIGTTSLGETGYGLTTSGAGYKSNTLSDLTTVSKTGSTKYAVITDRDSNNSPPGGNNYRDFYMSEQTGTGNDPYLYVTYSAITAPNAPTGCNIIQGTTPTALTISWTDNSSDEDNFVVEKSTNGGAFGTYATLGANVTSTTDTLTVGNTYQYRVKATNAGGSSAYSTSATLSLQSGSLKMEGIKIQ
jgi:hypothetical protein